MTARREVMLWASATYGAWTATWLAYRGASGIWPDAAREHATWWWLGAKLAVWLAPVLLLIARRGHRPLDWLGLGHARGIGRGVAGTAVFMLVLVLIDALVPGRWPSRPDLATTRAPELIVILLVSPALEEVLFRGYALGTLTESGEPFWRANLLAAGLFGLLHLPGWLFQGRSLAECAALGVNVTLLGFVFGALRYGGVTLWASILAHVLNNAWHAGWLVCIGDLLVGKGAA